MANKARIRRREKSASTPEAKGARRVEPWEIILAEEVMPQLKQAILGAVHEIGRKGWPFTMTVPAVEYFELSASGRLSYVCSLGQLFSKIEIESGLWNWRQ